MEHNQNNINNPLSSLFNKLFGKRKQETVTDNNDVKTSDNNDIKTPDKKDKSKVQDMVLISIADKYKVGEKNYPDYLRIEYGIGFPNEHFKTLEISGYIRASTAKETLNHLKLAELKAIAAQYNLKVSGKKDDLCLRLSQCLDESELGQHISDRYWVITEKGRELLDANPYIEFYLSEHKYHLSLIGLDLFSIFKLFKGKNNARVRDIIWGEFNRKSMVYYSEAVKTGKFNDYCNLLCIMALFLEEEERYKYALEMYMRYVFYKINFDIALQSFNYYSNIKLPEQTMESFFISIKIFFFPFVVKDIINMSNNCEFDSFQLSNFMCEAFSKENDTGVFTAKELTDLTMCALNGDKDGQKKICNKAMKNAIKKLTLKK